jgi:very-short-patch-repair endonuclease
LNGYPQAQLNFPVPIRGLRKKRWADVAIVNLKVSIEYDGQKKYAAHFTPAGRIADKERDAELELMGWRVIHVNKNNWNTFFADIHAYIKGEKKLASQMR